MNLPFSSTNEELTCPKNVLSS